MKLNRRPGARQRGVPPGHPGRRHEHPPTPRKNVPPRRQIPDTPARSFRCAARTLRSVAKIAGYAKKAFRLATETSSRVTKIFLHTASAFCHVKKTPGGPADIFCGANGGFIHMTKDVCSVTNGFCYMEKSFCGPAGKFFPFADGFCHVPRGICHVTKTSKIPALRPVERAETQCWRGFYA